MLIIKLSGDIQICGDYKLTVSPYIKLERAIFPQIKELLIGIKTKGRLSIIDLSQTYLQLSLDLKSEKLTALSTLKIFLSYTEIYPIINAYSFKTVQIRD